MEGRELLRVGHRHRLPRFEIEDHFMLRAVKLKHAVNVFHQRNREHEQHEDRHADHSVRQIEHDPPIQRRVDSLQPRRQIQRNELVHENEHQQRNRQIHCQHPPRHFLRRLALLCFFFLEVFQLNVGGEFERLHAQRHGLIQRAHSAQNRILENRVDFGDLRQRHLLRRNLPIGFPHRDAIGMRRAHHHTLHHRLSADECFLAAFQNRH